MEKAKKGKLWHRIKYRNSVAPSATPLTSENLRQFAIELRRRHRVMLYINKVVKKRKSEERSVRVKVEPLRNVSSTDDNIQEFCRKCPSIAMSRFQEKDILKKVAARGLELRYSSLLNNIMAETREEFLKVTQQSGIEMKLCSVEKQFQIHPYKYLGRTENYSVFLQRRKELKTKFILHYPLIRRILNECVTKLPHELFNLNSCFKSQLDSDAFQKHIFDYANDAAQSLQEFYRRIVVLVEREKVNLQNSRSFLGACTGLLSVNISRTIAHTLLHVVSFTGSKKHIPYLKLNISFKDRLILQPTADDVIEIYSKFLKKIIDSSKQFYVLEKYKLKGFDNKQIYLCLTDEFLDSILEQLSCNINEKYEPISKYIKQLEDDFVDVYGDLRSGVDTVSTSDLIFEEGCEKLSYFKSYLPKVAFIPDNAYFTIGQLIIIEYRETLKQTLLDIIDSIFSNLSAQHEWENNDICEAFDIIYVRATQKPITTEEVIEIGKYMAWVRAEYLDELRERVIKALAYLTKLIQLGPLNENHIITNAKAINWLDEILPILEENSITYEQLKFEAEEKLQRVIEDINVDIKDVYPLLDILDSMDNIENVRGYLNTITLHMVKIKNIESKIDWINKEEVSLSFPKSSYSEFEELKNYVYPFYHLLKMCLNVQRNLSVWLDGQFDLINYKKVRETVEKLYKELLSTQKVYRNKLRQAQDENLSLRFKGTVDDPDMLNWPAPLKLCSKAIKLIQDFEPSLAVIKIMCNEALMKRHWQKMSKVAGFDITPNAGTTLRKIIQIDLKPSIDKYESISFSAVKERELFESLEQMLEEWTGVNFKTGHHEETKIILQLEDIEVVADDHIIKVINMLNSIYVKPYHSQVKDFYNKLLRITKTAQECRQAQQQWLHFFPLFLCDEITNRMSAEANIFKQITTTYTDYVEMIHAQPNVYTTVNNTNILQDLLDCNQQFELINQGVNRYFAKIRCYFPRFYFTSNQEMFRILSLTKDPTEIHRFIRSLFCEIKDLRFNENFSILGIASENNEILYLIRPVDTQEFRGCVEIWLKELENQIRKSIRRMIQEAIKNHNQEGWILQWPCQILLAVTKIVFTLKGTDAINNNTLDAYRNEIFKETENIIKCIKSSELSNITRSNVKSLLVMMSDNKQIITTLLQRNTNSSQDFKWLSQIRYYPDDDNCVVQIFDNRIDYGYEYNGVNEQIVTTPATERCCHALTLAYKHFLCAGLQGNTGTGKTHTVKGLAKAVAIQCTSFTCSSSIESDCLLRFLKGIASNGSWLLLEEIDKIPTEVCSLLSQEISKLLTALKTGISNIVFNSTEIQLQRCFICCTMKRFDNFPKNFRILCRPVVMTIPDYQIIAQVTLFSLGYCRWMELGRRITTLYQLAEDLLPLSNNDFGLRALKEVLNECGKSINSDLAEEQIIYNCIYRVTGPKLMSSELQVFENILTDLFAPGQVYKKSPDFEQSVIAACKVLNLDYNTNFTTKIAEIHNAIGNKKGTLIVGSAFTAKTTSIRVLCSVFSDKSINVVTVNSKTLSLKQLYGGFGSVTQKWSDGIVTKHLRGSKDETWIILDGSIDSLWVEAINTVLDADQKLCLASGEVLHLSENSRIIFEVDNLNCASPAVICRCDVVYMNKNVVGWKPLVTTWLQGNDFEWQKGFEENFLVLFEWVVPPCLEFISSSCQLLCNVNEISLVKTAIQILEMFLIEAYEAIVRKEDDPKNLSSWIQASFIQAVVWGLGSNLDYDSRLKFDEFFKLLWRGQNQCHPYPQSLEKVEVSVPAEEMIFDYSYLYKSKGNWKFWPDVLKNEKIEESGYLSDIFVPTNESIKYATIINLHINYKYPVLLVGPSGTGKSSIMLDILMNKVDQDLYELNLLTFTSKLVPSQAREMILSKLFKKKSGRYGPSEGKRCILFIDDFSEPVKDKFGTHPTLETIRELLDHKKWYNSDNFKPLYVDNINILATMTTFRNYEISQRLLRHFNVFSINELPEDSITRIFSTALFTKWKKMGFPSDIIGTINQIVSATYHFYKSVSDLKPTLNWNFYYFHMKNFSRVIQVCSMIRKESADANKKLFFKLWVHEILRVLGDRLLDKDKDWIFDNIKFCVENFFKDELRHLFENVVDNDDAEPDLSKIFFGSYMDKGSGRYDEADIDKLEEIATSCVREYNKDNFNKMDLVFFSHALEHLSKICRIISLPCCNLIQVGICGIGRLTLVKLACLIYDQELFRLKMTENYSCQDWRNAVKSFLKEAGGSGKSCTFFLKEEQIVHDIIFEDLDCLLKTGQIPFLYSLEEKQEILDLVRNSIHEKEEYRNIGGDSESIFLFYQKRCRENLHIIMSFNPLNSAFRTFLRTYPSLCKFCEIIYLEKWPTESLESIARAWTQDLNIGEETKTKVTSLFSFFHIEAEKISDGVHVTTGSFMEFVRLYVDLIKFKQQKITDVKQRYLAALEKLSFAALQISEMQKSLADYQPQLEAMTIQAIEMAKQIETETIEVEKASDLVKKDEEIANEQAAAAQILKLDCEADLAQAIPILEDAISALNTLKPTDITLVKSMKNPPDAIKLVMAAVCVIKDVKPDRIPDPSTGRKTIDYWGPSKRILGDMNFLQTLKDFDKDNIKPEIMVKIRKDYLPHKDFKPHVVAKASSAAEGLCKWIIAMDMYDKVAKEVAPKKEKLEKAEQEYGITMIILNEKKEQVTRIEQKLADLNAVLKEATRKQKKLQRDVDICKKKLNRAQKLIEGLSEEKVRWTNAVDVLQQQYDHLPGDIMLSSAFVAYLGPFRMDDRKKTLTAWLSYISGNDIPLRESYDFLEVFEKDVDYDSWHLNGLSKDRFFVENGVIAKFSKRWCLFIDPQNQANNWIKSSEKQNGLKVTKFACPDYINTLKQCIVTGTPLLFENVGKDLKPFLTNVITRNTFYQNEIEYINIGGHVVNYNRNFILYMTTNLKYCVYSSEIYDKITVIDFTINRQSLEDHLLTCVVEVEKPTLKNIKTNLNKERKRNKDALNDIELRILKTLSDSKTDILEDEQALQILDKSKILSKKIQQKQEASIHVEETLNNFRAGYQSVAKYSANLYFTTYQLTKINHMYQFSYNWFIETYSESIQNAHRFKLLKSRCKSLIDTLTSKLYCKICRSIFEKDKLLFSFLLSINLLLSEGKVSVEEIDIFTESEEDGENLVEGPEWLPRKSWRSIYNLKKLESYKDLPDYFVKNEKYFQSIFSSKTPEKKTFPEPFNNRFTKLLIINFLRPDRTYVSIYDFVKEELGSQFVKPPFFDITFSFNESYILSPLIFMLKTGTDAINSLLNFAKTKNFQNKLILASTKSDQEDAFYKNLEKAKKFGLWICLQNCHLLTSRLPLLDLKLEEIDYSNTHENFRLWLTTDETDDFPISLLEKSVKITKETPINFRNKMEDLFTQDPINSPSFYSNCPGKHEIFNRLLYSMTFMHCVLQERRKFGPYGFNVPYDFDDIDFLTSIYELQDVLNQRVDPFEEIVYLIKKCSYGGHIVDQVDSKLLHVIVTDYLNPLVAKNELNAFIYKQGFGLPVKTDYQDYINHILKLPETVDGTVFGLHENYEIVRDLEDSKLILHSISLAFNDLKREENLTNISQLIETLKLQLPLNELLCIDDPVDRSITELCILEEIKIYNRLLTSMKASLQSLQKVVDNVLLMDDWSEKMCHFIINNQVPSEWMKLSCINTNCLSSFAIDLSAKINYFKNFKPGQDIWLASFYNPRAFLTATKFLFCRKKSILIDEIVFQLKNTEDADSNDNILVSGLHLTGAIWNEKNQCLEELLPKVINYQMPPVLFTFSSDCEFYECPLYTRLNNDLKNSSNFIIYVLIRTEKCREHWIRRGTSLVCQL